MISKISTGLAVAIFAIQASAQSGPWGQCGGNGYTGPKTCVSGYTCKESNPWYSQCLPGSDPPAASSSAAPVTTVKPTSSIKTSAVLASSTTVRTSVATTVASTAAPSATQAPPPSNGAIVTPTKVSTVFPQATGSTLLPAPTTIKAGTTFDGKMARWDRDSVVCQGQTETGEKDTIFILEEGATLANVIIGKNQAEGVHCKGTCTLINVWHEDVCEDGVTFKQSGGTSYVIGGGARNADDKILQFNGKGKVIVKHFYATKFGKVMRHCGTCGIIERHTEFDGIVADGGSIVVGINTNAGDTTTISNSCIKGGTKFGDRFNAVSSGEPTKIGSCPFGTSCVGINNVSTC